VDANLDFKGSVAVFLVNWEICIRNEGNLLIWCFSTEDVSERDVLESLRLSNIIVIWLVFVSLMWYDRSKVLKAYNIDSSRDTGTRE
jgi:hypothetical protein